MWLSDNQSKPLVDLQEDSSPEGHSVLVNYLFPQAPTDTEEIGKFVAISGQAFHRLHCTISCCERCPIFRDREMHYIEISVLIGDSLVYKFAIFSR